MTRIVTINLQYCYIIKFCNQYIRNFIRDMKVHQLRRIGTIHYYTFIVSYDVKIRN